jgi:hypothetical protein
VIDAETFPAWLVVKRAISYEDLTSGIEPSLSHCWWDIQFENPGIYNFTTLLVGYSI